MTMRDGYTKILVQLKNSHKSFLILGDTIDLKSQINENELLIESGLNSTFLFEMSSSSFL